MNFRIPLLLILTSSLGLPAFGDSRWSDVPASRANPVMDTIEIAGDPTEAVVTLVGPDSTRAAAPSAPLRVVGIDLALAAPARIVEFPVSEAGMVPIPEGARWPDANGRIAAEPAPRDPSADSRLRNPWQVRVRRGPSVGESQFVCGGIVAGGSGGPIGILNGHIVKRGDSLGTFSIAGIVSVGVLLERGGTYFVVPRGRRILVATVDL
jgi:hypothetical protein